MDTDTSMTNGTTATLSWVPPTQNEDATPLMDLAGYRIYYGTSQYNYPNVIDISNPGLSEYVVENLDSGTYYFVITAYDALGVESRYSDAVAIEVL